MNAPLTEQPDAMTLEQAKATLDRISMELGAIRRAFMSYGPLAVESSLSDRAGVARGYVNDCRRTANRAIEVHNV